MYKVLTLNNISVEGLRRLPRELYEVASEIQHPDGIMVRSFKMHDMEIAESVKAVARAGAGVNNIPVDALASCGIPVFNAPGANANAVKELVVSGMLLAARNLCPAWEYVRELEGDGAELSKKVEAGKKQFVGYELPSRTLGVLGLGAIGVQVANTALSLGMRVIGFDPQMTVQRAWELSSGVEQARSLDDLVSRCDMLTVHVPLVEETKNLINAERIALMPAGSVIVNFSRGGIVADDAVIIALDDGHLSAYVTDFPDRALIGHEKVIALPHLGASTNEAESNCAVMVADSLRNYLENGIIKNSVNFPDADIAHTDSFRLTVANENVPNMVGQISTILGDAGLNIEDLLNKSRGDLAYTIVDLDAEVPDETIKSLRSIEGVLCVRNLGRPHNVA
ncbi:MAG: 3-phosphoglycerate dehydrogenase [Chromatiales bacterium]|jgi:D-3-phosphoglycerate dehydrogenase|nr:3-phosphoglycerate dehydrogenase [Chromatiales bacterium]